MTRPSMEAFLAHAREQIAEHGCMIQNVFPTEASPGIRFAYTVGLAQPNAHGEARRPEFLVSGLPSHLAGRILDHYAKRVLEDSESFTSHQIDVEGNTGYPITFLDITVANSREHLALANRFYADDLVTGVVPALQIVFPDDAGRWPWDEGSEVGWTPLLGAHP